MGNYTQWPTSFTLIRSSPYTQATGPEPSSVTALDRGPREWAALWAATLRRLRLVIEREPERLSVTLGKHVGKTLTIGILERLRCPAPVTEVSASRSAVERGGGAPLSVDSPVSIDTSHRHTHTHTHMHLSAQILETG